MVNYIHSVFSFKKASPARKIMFSFLFVILTGAFLLTLPISHQSGEFYNIIDALFSATSATCVTGLVVDVTVNEFTIFGQIVIMSLIQIGGLGLMTLMAVFILIMKNRLSMNEKITMKEMLNQEKVFNMHKFILDILKYTILFEGIGMVLLSFVLIPEYGIISGLFKAMFLSISAFCNAGFDVLGATSLNGYVHNPLVMITIMMLIILGGIGFAVWFDVRDKLVPLLKRETTFKKFRKSLSLHTRIVIIVTISLIVLTALLILVVEFQNAGTIGTFNFPQKILTSTFESVTLRTAGFASIDYASLQLATKFLMVMIMFIGGSPGGTAGGVKTTTVAVLILYVYCSLRGRSATTIFKRTIPSDIIIRATGIFFINLVTLFTGVFLLCIFEDKVFIDLLFEAASAMATVGLSLGITPYLSAAGKIVIILLMFVGRIGITTFVMSLVKPSASQGSSVAYPSGNIIVG